MYLRICVDVTSVSSYLKTHSQTTYASPIKHELPQWINPNQKNIPLDYSHHSHTDHAYIAPLRQGGLPYQLTDKFTNPNSIPTESYLKQNKLYVGPFTPMEMQSGHNTYTHIHKQSKDKQHASENKRSNSFTRMSTPQNDNEKIKPKDKENISSIKNTKENTPVLSNHSKIHSNHSKKHSNKETKSIGIGSEKSSNIFPITTNEIENKTPMSEHRETTTSTERQLRVQSMPISQNTFQSPYLRTFRPPSLYHKKNGASDVISPLIQSKEIYGNVRLSKKYQSPIRHERVPSTFHKNAAKIQNEMKHKNEVKRKNLMNEIDALSLSDDVSSISAKNQNGTVSLSLEF